MKLGQNIYVCVCVCVYTHAVCQSHTTYLGQNFRFDEFYKFSKVDGSLQCMRLIYATIWWRTKGVSRCMLL
jgi:hypothetical protein